MNVKKMSINKPIISITELVQTLQLSRARFYQLVKSGFFPKPLIDSRSKRPYYDIALQQIILEARNTGIGIDGSLMLFYSSRKSETAAVIKKKKVDPLIKELVETLESMGLDTTVEQVKQGLIELYPDGTDAVEQGVVIRDLFRHLRSK
jgi:hypothetical protein